MHRDFRRLLNHARGASEFPIAMNVDIRGFTKWSGDSAESGLFIKKTYIRLIDDYLSDASFFKATGDGLLVIFPVNEDDPKVAVRSAVNVALKIVRDFPKLHKGDRMLNFPTPNAVGVGLARGPASRLVSGRKTLDYSGTTLNLASRLMGLARPLGVVLDGEFGQGLLTPSVASMFESKRVYLDGIAPKKGKVVYYTGQWTEIPLSALKPLEKTEWGEGVWQVTRKELMEISGTYRVRVDSVPVDPSDIRCYVKHAAPTKSGGRAKGGRWTSLNLSPDEFIFRETPEGPMVVVQMDAIHRILERLGAGPSWPVEVRAEFVAA